MTTGATVISKCVRGSSQEESLGRRAPQLLRPVFSLWPAIQSKTEVGGDPSPGWAGRKVLTELRAFARQQVRGRAEKLGARALRAISSAVGMGR